MNQSQDQICGVKTSIPESTLRRIVDCVVASVPTDEIYLFGSQARNEASSDSDIDLYVVTADNAKSRSDYAADVYLTIPWLKMPKDILTSPRDVFEQRSREFGAIERTIRNEGVKIYG